MFLERLSFGLGRVFLGAYKLLRPGRIETGAGCRFSLQCGFNVCKGSRLVVGPGCRAAGVCHFYVADGGTVEVGANVFFNSNCSVTARKRIEIGDDSLFGDNVKIYDHNHRFGGRGLMRRRGFSSAPVRIGSNTWIASNVVILKGVTIGNNCVVSAGVVVDFDVPDDTLVKPAARNVVFERIRRE